MYICPGQVSPVTCIFALDKWVLSRVDLLLASESCHVGSRQVSPVMCMCCICRVTCACGMCFYYSKNSSVVALVEDPIARQVSPVTCLFALGKWVLSRLLWTRESCHVYLRGIYIPRAQATRHTPAWVSHASDICFFGWNIGLFCGDRGLFCCGVQWLLRERCGRVAWPTYALQHTATHCNTLQHIATHCSALQHTAKHCNTLQHTDVTWPTHAWVSHITSPHLWRDNYGTPQQKSPLSPQKSPMFQ